MADELNLDALDAQEQQIDLDSLDVDTPQDLSKSLGDRLATHTAVLSNTDNSDYFKAMNIALGTPDKREQLSSQVVKRTQNQRRALDNHFRNTVESAPQGIALATQARVDAQTVLDTESMSPVAEEVATAKEMMDPSQEAPFDVREQVAQASALRLAQARDIMELLDNQGTLDKTLSYAGFLVPFGVTSDVSDLLSDDSLDFSNATNIRQFILDYQALPVARREAYWPQLKQATLEATQLDIFGKRITDPNIPKAGIILTAFLNPQGATDAEFDVKLDLAFGALDVLGVGAVRAVLGNIIQSSLRSTNLISTAAGVGNRTGAVEMATAAAGSPQIAETVGVTQQAAMNMAMPFKNKLSLVPEHIEGLSPDVLSGLNDFQKKANGVVFSLREEGDLIREGAVSMTSRNIRVQSEIDNLSEVGDDLLQEGIRMENIQVGKFDNTEEFTVSYNLTDEAGNTVDFNDTFRWTLADETGNFKETVQEFSDTVTQLGSPTWWGKGSETEDFLGSAKTAIRLDSVTAAARKTLTELNEASLKPLQGLSKFKARERANLVDIAGDESINPGTGIRGKVFSVDELMAGVPTYKGTVRMTSPKEIESYYSRRLFNDTIWQLENQAKRRELELQGHVAFEIQGLNVFAREMNSAGAVIEDAGVVNKIRAYDKKTDEFVTLTGDDITELYDDGQKIVKFRGETQFDAATPGREGGEVLDYAIISKRELGALPQQVLHYKPGYAMKINQEVEYLVKKKIPTVKNGSPIKREITERFFASKADADQFVARENARIGSEVFTARPDREIPLSMQLDEGMHSSGGLVTGARSSKDLLTGLSGVRTERLAPLEVQQRASAHAANLLTRNEWRIGQERQWMNTANRYFPGKYKSFAEADTVGYASGQEGQALQQTHRQINQWNNVPTREEGLFEAKVQSMHDWALAGARRIPGLQDKTSVPSILWLKHADFSQAAKTAAFHSLLGVFNPAQLFVQASGATLAISRFNPIIGAAAVKDAFVMGTLDLTKNVKALRQGYREMGANEATLLQEVHESWLKTGLKDSVRTNADYSMAETGRKMTMDSFKRIADTNLIFYRAGELFNRRVSWSASYRNWKNNNPGKTPDQDGLKAILSDANLSMLELSKANAARWQGGADENFFRRVLGMMFQFGQVTAKATELSFKGARSGGFTMTEKLKILAGETAFFGAAGVPIGNVLAPHIMEAFNVDTQSLSPAEINRLNQGLWGTITLDVLGAEVDISNRGEILGSLVKTYRDILFSDTPLSSQMLGAFGTVADRTLRAFNRLAPLVMSGIKGQEISQGQLKLAMIQVAKITSTGTQAHKAWVMNQYYRILDRHGIDVVNPQDFNAATEFATAMGFQPTQIATTYDQLMDNKGYQERVTKFSDDIISIWHDWMVFNDMDESQGANVNHAMQIMYEFIDNEKMEADVRKAVEKKIFEPGPSKQAKAIKKVFDRLVEDQYGSLVDTHNSIFGNIQRGKALRQPIGQQIFKE